MKYENEEFRSDEYFEIKENLSFEAEEYKIPEFVKNVVEEFKVSEIEKRVIEETTTIEKKHFGERLNDLKTTLNSMSTSIATSVVAVAAVGVGAITLTPPTEEVEPPIYIEEAFGHVEFLNYYIDYYDDSKMNSNVRIYFDVEFFDGFYATIENKVTNEIQTLESNFVCFENIGNEITDFNVSVFNDNKEVVETFDIAVNPVGSNDYLGYGDLEYDVIENIDGSFNLLLTLDNSSSYLYTSITDINGNSIDYDVNCSDNIVEIVNIEEEININVNSYYLKDGNFYLEKMYELKRFNILQPSHLELNRVEILNDSYMNEFGVPTYLYFDGYLTGRDNVEVAVYDESGNELAIYSNIVDLSQPIVCYNLPSEEVLTFKYKIYHKESIIFEQMYQTDLTIPEEYLSSDFYFTYPNPNDCLITYNDDGTYNCYVYTGFANNSDYEMIYKLELVSESNSYEYFGTAPTASYTFIDLEGEYYSLVYKIFVCDGVNYYAVDEFYLASGSITVDVLENGEFAYPTIEIIPYEDKQYELYTSSYLEGDVNVEVVLSTGQTINYIFTKEDFEEMVILDLTTYEYESITIKVTANVNPYYGMIDFVLETDTVIIGQMTKTVIVEFNE